MREQVASLNTTFQQKGGSSAVHLDKSILIRADAERVFGWLAPHRQPSWDHSLVRATALAGGRFDRVGRALGHRFESHALATAFDPGRLFAWRQLDGDYEEHRGAFTLESVPEGTRLHLVADVEFPYVMPRVVEEAELRRLVSEGADDALLTLKEMVERGRPAR